jgi:hypothetical protein
MELQEPIVRKSRLSLEMLLAEVEQTLRDARADRAHSACVAALGLVVKIHELVRLQGGAEIGGGAMDATQIMDLLCETLGGPDGMLEMADRMREHALAQRAEQAITVS